MSNGSLPFRPGSVTWKINMEPLIVLGGGRALLLQVLHPLVAAGVEDHSNFEQDPFRRGFRTADMMLKLAFGEPEVSERQADLLHQIHERVKGVSTDGAAYDALDPDLLLWVWATLVEVSILMYQAGVAPLAKDERERYYEEQKLIAYASGVPRNGCPETYDDFVSYMQKVMDTELLVTNVARVVAYAGRHPPLPRPFGSVIGVVGSFFTAGMLPKRFRDELGYSWSSAHEAILKGFFLVSRVLARLVPPGVRHLPCHYLIRRKTPLGLWRNRPVRIPDDLSAR